MSELIGKPELLKKINVAKIMDLIRKQGPISRADISKTLNISRPTISKLIASLLLEKEIIEIGEGESSGGKKPILIKINSDNAYVIGIHLSYPLIKVALANNLGIILAREVIPASTAENDVLEPIIAMIISLLKSNKKKTIILSAIGIALAGMVNPQTGEIISTRAVSGLKGKTFKEKLEKKFKVPVFIDNDVYMGVTGQAASLESPPRSMAFVTVGELVGLGMMIENKVYRGARLAAGEIGDMIIDSEQQFAAGFEPEGGYLERWLGWADNEEMLMADVQHDSEDQTFISQYQLKIACCLTNIICLFDPERIFIGGKILQCKRSYLQQIEDLLHSVNKRAPMLEPAHFAEDTELMGSIYTAIQNLQHLLSIDIR